MTPHACADSITSGLKTLQATVHASSDDGAHTLEFKSPKLVHNWHLLAVISGGAVIVRSDADCLAVQYEISMKKLVIFCLLFTFLMPLLYVIGSMPLFLVPACWVIIWFWLYLVNRLISPARFRAFLERAVKQ